jgi:hypothetical protein
MQNDLNYVLPQYSIWNIWGGGGDRRAGVNGDDDNLCYESYIWNLQYLKYRHKFQIWWLILT